MCDSSQCGLGTLRGNLKAASIDGTGISIERQPVAFREILRGYSAGAVFCIDRKFRTTDQADLPELPRNDSGVRRSAAERGKYSRRIRHARDVCGCRFPSYQNGWLAVVGEALGGLAIQRDPPGGNADAGNRCLSQWHVLLSRQMASRNRIEIDGLKAAQSLAWAE